MGLLSLPFFCCGSGLAGAIAVVLGMLALERIKSAGGSLRGKGWAWTGLSTGLVAIALSLAWFSFASAALQHWNKQLDDGVRATFAAKDEESAREALTMWAGKSGPGVSSATIAEFAAGVRTRLGELESVSLVSQDASAGSLDALLVVHVVNLEFEKGSRSAVVATELRTPVMSWTPVLKLVKIHLNDAEAAGGVTEFPAPAGKPEFGTDGESAGRGEADRNREVAP